MSLKQQIEEIVGVDGAVASQEWVETVTDRKMVTYSVNYKGVVLQYVIPEEETDPGVIEDFLQHIEATTREATR